MGGSRLNIVLQIFILLSFTTSYGANIKISKKVYNAGEQIDIFYSGAHSISRSAWIGIIPSHIEHGSEATNDAHDVEYQYLSEKPNGSFSLDLPATPGKYDLRMSDQGKELASVSFTIKAIDQAMIDMKLSSSTVRPGSELKITINSKTKLSEDGWIGLVPSSVPHGDGDIIDQHDITYSYLGSDYNKTYTLIMPEKAGSYDIRLVNKGTGGHELLSKTITVLSIDNSKVTLTVDKKAVKADEPITVTFSGTEEFSHKGWIGIIPSNIAHGNAKVNDQHDLSYQYLEGKGSGSFTFIAPSKKGKYDFRLHNTEFGQEVASVSFEVTNNINAQSIEKELTKKGRVSLYGIYFDLNKDVIKAASYPLLEQVTLLLKNNQSLKLMVEGHTDSQGGDEYNKTLSNKRADAVRTYLINQGIKKERLVSKGYGESKPMADNSTEAGRALNRRVDLVKF